MKTYRRILVSIAAGGETHLLLQRAAGLAHAQHAQLLVVRILDGRSGFFVIQFFAHLDRQVAEYRPGFSTLNSLHPNILNDKRLKRPGRSTIQAHQQHRQEF